MTRHRDLLDSAVLAEHYPIFREAEKVIADPIVRNRGTIGGSLCQADPAEDLSAVGSALKGTVVDRRPRGRRAASRCASSTTGPYETVVAVRRDPHRDPLPDPPRCGVAYEKVERRAGDWAIAAASASTSWIERRRGRPSAASRLAAVGADHYCSPAAEAAPASARRRPRRTSPQAGGSPPPTAAPERRPARTGRLQAPPRRTNSPCVRCAAPRRAQPGSLSMQVTSRSTATRSRATSSRALLLVHFIRDDLRTDAAPTGAATPPTAAPASCGSTASR